MNKSDYQTFNDLLVSRLFEVSSYQRIMCGKVKNIGKNAQTNVSQTDIHCSLTYLDQFTQDYLLIPIYQRWPDLVPLVEEDTGLKRHHINNSSDHILIMDPIDGTAFYIRGEKDYSIMIGLMRDGEMELGLICYPEDDIVIGAIKGEGVWVHRKSTAKTSFPGIESIKSNQKNISCHYRFMQEPYCIYTSKLRDAGYTLSSNDHGFGTNATGILHIAEGKCCAFIGPHISLHDFAIPALLIQELGGVLRLYCYNGLSDTNSWSELLPNYGIPDVKGPNPRYRMIVADSERTINKIVSTMLMR